MCGKYILMSKSLTQMREELYQTLGAIAAQIAGFYQMTAALPAWAAALVGDLPMMPTQHLRLLTRHVITPLVKACPPAHRSAPRRCISLITTFLLEYYITWKSTLAH
jgi:hypothetical protein